MNTSIKPQWRKTKVQGLYEYRAKGLREAERGVYYSRIRHNGRRTFRSLETSVFERARIKHAKLMLDAEKGRVSRGDSSCVGDFKTLGALFEETKRRLAETSKKPATVNSREDMTARLRHHWQRGSFDTFLARNVTAEIVRELRDYMCERAKWEVVVRGAVMRRGVGYGPRVVNQSLWILRLMLEIAVEKMVISENPFSASTTLRENLYARVKRVSVDIPDRVTMNKIFAETRRLPDNLQHQSTETRAMLQERANELADHAELLAFSGMRRNEAKAALVGDDLGDEFKIRGTKSETSNRIIPVNPSLRAVLDRIKSRRIGANTPLCDYNEPKGALRRACKRLNVSPLTNHSLRHYFASVCIASGVDIPTVSRWLGHADGGALAMETYGHLLKDASHAAAKKVDFTGSDAQSKIA